MKKKVLSVLLCGAMVAGCLSGCGSKSETPNDAPAETTDDAADAAEPADDAADAETEPAADAASAVDTLIANTSGTVTLRVWAGEEDQEVTQELIDGFTAKYPEVTFDITVGVESESTAKDTILTDVEAAADVFTIADDQVNDLVNAGALQEVSATYTFDVKSENSEGAITAASVGDKLYAYPMTADNGYFMFYDASVFSEEDVASLDTMIEKAKEANRKIGFQAPSGWYLESFFGAAGCKCVLNPETGANECDWNSAQGVAAAQALSDYFATGVFVNMQDAEMATGITDGSVCAAVNGVWNAQTAEDAWGENYRACKLPTAKIGGQDVQLRSVIGCKLIGVNPHSQFVGWSMLLAEHLTNIESQVYRFQKRGYGPSNIAAASTDEVLANKAVAALAAQSAFGNLQRVGANFWSPTETLGSVLAESPSSDELQGILDTAVEGITAPVEESAE